MAGIIGLLNFSSVSSVTGIPVFVLWILAVVLYYILGFIYLAIVMVTDFMYDENFSLLIVTFWPLDLFRRIITFIIEILEAKFLPPKLSFFEKILDAIFG